MRRGVVIMLAILAALLAAPSADAGFAAQLKIRPSVVDVGHRVLIELRAYSLNAGVRRLDDVTGRRLGVEAVSPERSVIRVRLRHVTRGVWRGSFTFRESGRWLLRVANWPRGKKPPRLYVTVREPVVPPPATTTTTTTP